MMRAKDLHGRAVIDLESARKLGSVGELLLDPQGRQIAGLVVSEGGSLLGGQHHMIVPAAALHAIGEDAITVRDTGSPAPANEDFGGLPRLSKLLGRRVVTQGGKLLGSLEDVLIEGANGRISGYLLGASHEPGEAIEGWFGGGKSQPRYVRADTDIRVGEDLIVVPDNAVIEGEPPDSDARAARGREPAPGQAAVSPDRRPDTDDRAAQDYAEADRLLRSSAPEEAGSPRTPQR
ncbi:MAG TPA: PRC-barrel domain-containing protein [Chloroflexota bacterium]|nr:PRC-barrel domain-containing protein [Chloroflexota bacterium]